MQAFIQQLPKAELHLHIEGSLEPEMLLQLAERNKIKVPFNTVEEVRTAYQFKDLQSFLNIYYQGMNVLVTEEDFYDLTYAYFERAKEDNITHAEIFFDPQAHMQRGIELQTALNGIFKGMQDSKVKLGISNRLIMCFLRDQSADDAMSVLEKAFPFRDRIIGVGLDSAEVGNPCDKFKAVFDKARSMGFMAVAHAGEEGGAENIWQAINDLGVKRIDHGVKAIHDAELIERLVQEKIPLTICPLSNLKLKVYSDMKQHSIKQLMDAGVCVTINSDDPAYFGGYINENYLAVQKAFDLDQKSLIELARNSFNASFLSPTLKKQRLDEIDKAVQLYQNAS